MTTTTPSRFEAGLDIESMYRSHYAAVMRYVRARVRSRDVAEDLVGDVFCRAAGAARRYIPLRETTLPWLYTIAAHRVADHYRRQRPTYNLDAIFGIEDGALSPDEQVAIRDQVEQVWRAAQNLPDSQRRALCLRYGEQCELREISARMGRSVEAVKLLIHRATRSIRASLDSGTPGLRGCAAGRAA